MLICIVMKEAIPTPPPVDYDCEFVDVSLANVTQSHEQPGKSTVRRPESMAERQASLRDRLMGVVVVQDAHVESERLTTHQELGGLRRTERVHYDDLLRQYQPWMRDITVAMERYALFDMERSDITAMTTPDRNRLALDVDGYMEGLAAVRRVIKSYADVPDNHDFMDKYKMDGQLPTKQELNAYFETINVLRKALKEAGTAGYLQTVAIDNQPSQDQRRAQRRSAKSKTHVQVSFIDGKYRLQR